MSITSTDVARKTIGRDTVRLLLGDPRLEWHSQAINDSICVGVIGDNLDNVQDVPITEASFSQRYYIA